MITWLVGSALAATVVCERGIGVAGGAWQQSRHFDAKSLTPTVSPEGRLACAYGQTIEVVAGINVAPFFHQVDDNRADHDQWLDGTLGLALDVRRTSLELFGRGSPTTLGAGIGIAWRPVHALAGPALRISAFGVPVAIGSPAFEAELLWVARSW